MPKTVFRLITSNPEGVKEIWPPDAGGKNRLRGRTNCCIWWGLPRWREGPEEGETDATSEGAGAGLNGQLGVRL